MCLITKLATVLVSMLLRVWHAVGHHSTKAHQQLKQKQGKIHFKQWSLNSCFVTMTSVSAAGQTYNYIGEWMTHISELEKHTFITSNHQAFIIVSFDNVQSRYHRFLKGFFASFL